MIKIYHNPRCGKSREGLKILETQKLSFEIVKYLETPPTRKDLERILNKMGKKPIDIVRVKESFWIENFKGKTLTDDQVLDALVNQPKLIERPIVETDTKAVLGRPPENIKDLF